jgi:hypothetical protein
LSDFERGQIAGARLAGVSVIKTAPLLCLSRATVSKVMSAAYTNHGKTTSAKRNSRRNSTLTERDRRTLRWAVSKKFTELIQHRYTAAEPDTHLEDHVFTKTDMSITNPTVTVELQLLIL